MTPFLSGGPAEQSLVLLELSGLGPQLAGGVALFGKVEKEGLARRDTECDTWGCHSSALTPICALSARSPALGAQHRLVT